MHSGATQRDILLLGHLSRDSQLGYQPSVTAKYVIVTLNSYLVYLWLSDQLLVRFTVSPQTEIAVFCKSTTLFHRYVGLILLDTPRNTY